jgi:8-oxo-dGTP pyrophosphatase MutT (NUDIX family)
MVVFETPEAAAIRELKEECNVDGKIIRMISHNSYSDENKDYTFLIHNRYEMAFFEGDT